MKTEHREEIEKWIPKDAFLVCEDYFEDALYIESHTIWEKNGRYSVVRLFGYKGKRLSVSVDCQECTAEVVIKHLFFALKKEEKR
jgi:hypothetical protein